MLKHYFIKPQSVVATPYLVVLVASLLVSSGSVRSIVGAWGYWGMWALIALAGSWSVRRYLLKSLDDRRFLITTAGFFILGIGLMLAAVINDDLYTAYQGVKFFCIYLMFLVVFCCVGKLTAEDISMISTITIGLAFVLFMISKHIATDLYVVLGDGRAGSQFAFPGVLWKTPAFFSGFVLAGALTRGRFSIVEIVVLFMSAYLLIVDSSRTGFIIMAVMSLIVLFRLRYRVTVRQTFYFALGIILLAIMLLVFSTDISMDLIIVNRIYQVDNIRIQLLVDGVARAKECFAWGCGFGNAFSIIEGEKMVLHNAYLAALADLGVLGLIGLLMLVIMPSYYYVFRLRPESIGNQERHYLFFAIFGVWAYGFFMMLHSLSSELSEWGIWIIMISLLYRFIPRRDERDALRVLP